jgi:membrane protease YdiL (CAAX protease family)
MHNAVGAIAMLHAICLIPAIVWGRSLWMRDLKWPTKSQSLVLVTSSILFIATAMVVYFTVGENLLSSTSTQSLIMNLGYAKNQVYPVGLYFVFVNATLEELYWRGVIFNRLEELQPERKWFALVWSSVTYALYHYSILKLVLYPGWAEFGVIFLAAFGAMTALIYRKTGSIIVASMYHAFLNDLCAILLIVVLFFRMHMGSLL